MASSDKDQLHSLETQHEMEHEMDYAVKRIQQALTDLGVRPEVIDPEHEEGWCPEIRVIGPDERYFDRLADVLERAVEAKKTERALRDELRAYTNAAQLRMVDL